MDKKIERFQYQDVLFLIERLQKEAEEKKREEKRQRKCKAVTIEHLRKIQRNRELLRQKTKEFCR